VVAPIAAPSAAPSETPGAAPVESLDARLCPACKKTHDGTEAAAMKQLAQSPARLAKLVKGLDANGWKKSYGPGKWSIRQILAHLRDCEMVYAVRWRKMISEENAVLTPFDQDLWASGTAYAKQDARQALATWSALRDEPRDAEARRKGRVVALLATIPNTGRSAAAARPPHPRARRQPLRPDRAARASGRKPAKRAVAARSGPRRRSAADRRPAGDDSSSVYVTASMPGRPAIWRCSQRMKSERTPITLL
jgi:hypothetical protein